MARLIADEFGVSYHEGHVWKILRALNWSHGFLEAVFSLFRLTGYYAGLNRCPTCIGACPPEPELTSAEGDCRKRALGAPQTLQLFS